MVLCCIDIKKVFFITCSFVCKVKYNRIGMKSSIWLKCACNIKESGFEVPIWLLDLDNKSGVDELTSCLKM